MQLSVKDIADSMRTFECVIEYNLVFERQFKNRYNA